MLLHFPIGLLCLACEKLGGMITCFHHKPAVKSTSLMITLLVRIISSTVYPHSAYLHHLATVYQHCLQPPCSSLLRLNEFDTLENCEAKAPCRHKTSLGVKTQLLCLPGG